MPDKLAGTRFMVVREVTTTIFDRELTMVKLIEDNEDMRRMNVLHLVMGTRNAVEFPIGSLFQIDITRRDEDAADAEDLF